MDKRIALTVGFSLLALPALAASRPSAEVTGWCAEVRGGASAADPYKLGKCAGYLRGFVAAADMEDARGGKLSVCVPDDVSDMDLIATFNTWVAHHADMGKEPDWFSLYNSLHAAFPCEKP